MVVVVGYGLCGCVSGCKPVCDVRMWRSEMGRSFHILSMSFGQCKGGNGSFIQFWKGFRCFQHRIHERDDLISILEPGRVIQPLACALQRPTRQSRPAEKPRIKP